MVLGIVCDVALFGRPCRRGAVLINSSFSELWVAGGGGAVMVLARMASKWDESVWRPGSMFMVGLRALM